MRLTRDLAAIAALASISVWAHVALAEPEGSTPSQPVGSPSSSAALPSAAPSPNATAPATAASASSGAPSTAGEEASPAATMFAKKCGSCHTLGEGDRTGPDLLGVTKRRDRKWLTSFIASPGTMIDGGDRVANDLLAKFKSVRMPDQALSEGEFSALFDYLDQCTARGGCKLAFGKVKAASEATPDDIAGGKALFEGRVPLANGGAACISCHNVRGAGIVGGGTLAKDLTHAYARLGENGASAALASTPFPLMKTIYRDHSLRDAEQFKLKAFLYASSRDGSPPRKDQNFLYMGVLGALASFGVIGAVWSGRFQGVRKRMVRRGHR